MKFPIVLRRNPPAWLNALVLLPAMILMVKGTRWITGGAWVLVWIIGVGAAALVLLWLLDWLRERYLGREQPQP